MQIINKNHILLGAEHLKTHTKYGVVASLSLCLMYFEGLRVSEVCEIKKRDLTELGNTYSLKFLGKGRRWRSSVLSEQTSFYLKEYLDSGFDIFGGDSLMVTPTKKPMYRKFLYRAVNDLFRDTVTPHALRHAFATVSRENNSTDTAISQQLGHTTFGVTMIYGLRSNYRIERDFHAPMPEKILTFPIPPKLRAGDFLQVEICEEMHSSLKKKKERLIFLLVCFGGVKSTEIPELTRLNFNKTNSQMLINGRCIPLSYMVSSGLSDYCKGMNPSDKLFKIKYEGVKSLFRRIRSKVGMPINGKILRSSYIVSNLDRGVDPISLAQMLGCTYENIARYIPCAGRARIKAIEHGKKSR
jgi:integrase/recombinase XerD